MVAISDSLGTLKSFFKFEKVLCKLIDCLTELLKFPSRFCSSSTESIDSMDSLDSIALLNTSEFAYFWILDFLS